MSISVVIPNWNGASLLPSCLDSLRRQTYPHFQTIVVDDGSTDGSLQILAQDYPEAQVVSLGHNCGFAAAANRGLAEADGETVVLLNNDVVMDSRFLEEVESSFQRYPHISWIAAKILLADGRLLHSAGDFYRLNGVPGNRGVWTADCGQYDRPELVFGACAGAAAYRRSLLEDVMEDGKVFDESLFMYYEDVDLNFRAQLLGHQCLYQPAAIAYHKLSASAGGPLASYYCGRNSPLVVLKDLPQQLLRSNWHRVLAAQIVYTLDSLWHFREPAGRARLWGQLAAIRAVSEFLRKRRVIQRRRRVTITYLRRILG